MENSTQSTESKSLVVTGIHHVTLISKDIVKNHAFWTRTLGLRLVKKSVNQDSPSDYHLFYGDSEGSPGTEVTFFDWPQTAPNRSGANSIDGLMLRVGTADSVDWWAERLKSLGVAVQTGLVRDGRTAIAFADPDGVSVEIVEDGDTPRAGSIWPESPVPAEHQIRGVYAVVLALRDPEATIGMMKSVLGFREVATYERDGLPTTILVAASGDPGRQVHVVHDTKRTQAMLGHGGIHHVAFRITDYPTYDAFQDWLRQNRIGHSGPVDRYWFRSIYFRTREGLVFELATDQPGFSADEPLESLGQKLTLAPFLEPMRAEIEAILKPISA